MSKHEFPPFKMTIEAGRLVPSTAYDAERLDSYRRGTRVFVRFTEEKDRVLVRKWWAILGLVVKQCDTPWQNKEQASEAIKLALGIVNLSKTVSGGYMQYPKSLTELEDPELQDAVEQMIELVTHLTGVDVETLKKETAHIVEEVDHDPETGEIADHESAALSADNPETPLPPGTEREEPAPVTSRSTIPAETREQFIAFTSVIVGLLKNDLLPAHGKRELVGKSEADWKYIVADHSKLESITLAAAKVINGDRSIEKFITYMAVDLLECDPAEIGG